MKLRLSWLEVFRRSLENLEDVISHLASLWHSARFNFYFTQFLIVEVALLFNTFNLFQEGLVLEKFGRQIILERLDEILKLLLTRCINHFLLVLRHARH